MKLTEFIRIYKSQDSKKMEEVKITKYLPMNVKIKIINEVSMILSTFSSGNINYIEIIKHKQMAMFFNLLLSYTDIKVDEYSEEVYDECMACGIEKFLLHFVKEDYERFCKMLNEATQISDTMLFRESIMQIGKTDLSEDFNNIISSIKENEGVFKNLNEILGINNIGLKGTTK